MRDSGAVQFRRRARATSAPRCTAMRDAMTHRGPDDAGLWESPDRRVVLAHRRLSIVDLSPAGHQPMSNEDGTVWITFNGEIYNHAALRPGLEAKGHRFRSRTDTEAIVHQYEDDGADCLARARRHVRVRHLGRRARAAAAGARSAGQEAALLHGGRRAAAVRLGDQGAARPPRRRARHRSRGAEPVPDVRQRAGAAHAVRGDQEAAGRRTA